MQGFCLKSTEAGAPKGSGEGATQLLPRAHPSASARFGHWANSDHPLRTFYLVSSCPPSRSRLHAGGHRLNDSRCPVAPSRSIPVLVPRWGNRTTGVSFGLLHSCPADGDPRAEPEVRVRATVARPRVGLPAAALPVGLEDRPLLSVQIIGPRYREDIFLGPRPGHLGPARGPDADRPARPLTSPPALKWHSGLGSSTGTTRPVPP